MSKIRLHGSSSGYMEIAPPAAGSSETITLPNSAGEVLLTDGSAASLTQIPAANLVGVCTSGLTKTGGFGKIIQVQSVTKTDTFSSSESQGNYTGAAISLNFTASSTSNKLLIMANLMVGAANGSERVGIILFAGGSKLAVGDASGSKRRISMGAYNEADNGYNCLSHSHLFTPASTSEITYDYRLHNGRGASGTLYLNRCYNESQDNTIFGRGVSTITIMEIAA